MLPIATGEEPQRPLPRGLGTRSCTLETRDGNVGGIVTKQETERQAENTIKMI
jgi:hypothetical protein